MAEQNPPKRTDGFQERLREALEWHPENLTMRGLSARLQAKCPTLRGTSPSGVRRYFDGDIRKPRVELLKAMADVLEVPWKKLAYDEGYPIAAGRMEMDGPDTLGAPRRLAEVMIQEGVPSVMAFWKRLQADGGFEGSYASAATYHRSNGPLSVEYLAAVTTVFGVPFEWLVFGGALPRSPRPPRPRRVKVAVVFDNGVVDVRTPAPGWLDDISTMEIP